MVLVKKMATVGKKKNTIKIGMPLKLSLKYCKYRNAIVRFCEIYERYYGEDLYWLLPAIQPFHLVMNKICLN